VLCRTCRRQLARDAAACDPRGTPLLTAVWAASLTPLLVALGPPLVDRMRGRGT
jgi:hypothetical protein